MILLLILSKTDVFQRLAITNRNAKPKQETKYFYYSQLKPH